MESKQIYKSTQNIDAYLAQYLELKRIADQPCSTWLTTTTGADPKVKEVTTKAKALNQVPVFVVYNIPNRDDGQFSAGGSSDATAYKAWIDKLTTNTMTPSVFIVEPDGLCLMNDSTTSSLVAYAAQKLRTTVSKTFIDIGHSSWLSVSEAVTRLAKAGIATADGFSLNVSNFRLTDDLHTYGDAIVSKLEAAGIKGKRYVIDTSRNGNGPLIVDGKSVWCNPSGRALGYRPRFNPAGHAACYAYLWVKTPGNSDGDSPTGAPAAGKFWLSYAQELVANSSK